MAGTFEILNPLAPMAFLAPATAFQYRISTYVIIGSAGALIWDILMNVHSDYKLLFEHRIAFPTIIYFFSRSSVLVSTMLNAVFRTAPVGSHRCQDLQTTQCVFYHIAFSSTALLFFLRVRAIFNRNKYVVAVFFLLWLGVLGGSITVALSGSGGPLEPTDYCMAKPSKPYISASPITLAINDTCVVLAISWRLLSSSWVPPDRKTSSPIKRVVVAARSLPAFSRGLLQDGQIYYLVALASNIISVLTVLFPSIPAGYRFMYVFNAVITNMMVCRVYRHTKFGDFREESISTTWIASHSGGNSGSWQASAAEGKDEGEKSAESEGTTAAAGQEAHRSVWEDFYEQWGSRLLFAFLVAVLVFLPVLCVSVCMHRRHAQQAMK